MENTKKHVVSDSVFYICVAVVLIFLIKSSESVLNNFIESTREVPQMIMMPGFMSPPESEEQTGIPRRGIAKNP